MIAIEVFRKKKKMEPILQKCWTPITEGIIYPAVAEEEPAQKLVVFGLVAYATVFASAVAGGMSSSAGHYLARMQLGKCNLGKVVNELVETTFSGSENEDEQANAELFQQNIDRMVAKLLDDDADIAAEQQMLAAGFRKTADVAPA